MTQKEKLYMEYITIYNKVCELNGKEPLECSEEFFNSTRFQSEARTKSKNEWREKICYQHYTYEREVMRLRIENYYNTEEGKEEKKKLTNQIENAVNERVELKVSTTKRIDLFIKEWLGNDWGCGLVGNSCIEIGMVENIAENKANHFYFGHTFTLYYNDPLAKDRFEMNYGCMGSFGLLDGSKESDLRCRYLLGMDKFSTNKEKLTELKNILDTFCKEEYKYSQTLDVLEHNLKHPFDKKNVALID